MYALVCGKRFVELANGKWNFASAPMFTSKVAFFRILGRPGKRFLFFLFSFYPFLCSFIYARVSIFAHESSMKGYFKGKYEEVSKKV